MPSHTIAPTHSAWRLCVVAKQQQACCVRSGPSQRPAVLQQPGGPRNPLWQDNNTVSKGKLSHTQNLKCILKYFSMLAEKHSYILICVFVCLCAASREACCRLVSPSEAGCVSVVWNLFRLQPHAGWLTCRIQSGHRRRWCQQPSIIPSLHRWETDRLLQSLHFCGCFWPLAFEIYTLQTAILTVFGFFFATDWK